MTDMTFDLAPGIPVSPRVEAKMVNTHGRDVTSNWFATIPHVLQTFCARWGISLSTARPQESYNIVLFGVSGSEGEVAIKLGPPSFENRAEIAATRLASGTGMVRLLDADPSASILLLERIRPGIDLIHIPCSDEDATRIAASSLKAFWRDPGDDKDLIAMERWAHELLEFTPRATSGFPDDLVLNAQSIARDMLAHPTSRSLIHGDMHHQNILWHRRNGWTTIDPKGLVGEKGYDIATWMMNPWGFPHSTGYVDVANRRLDILANSLHLDRDRLGQWAVVHAAMSLCWGLNAEHPEDLAGDIETLRQMTRLLG